VSTATILAPPACPSCQTNASPVPGQFCCETAELAALRDLMVEVTRSLDSEIVIPLSIGDCDSGSAAILPLIRTRIRQVTGR
jgi:hypothetical protein